jgi:hypothetical protein
MNTIAEIKQKKTGAYEDLRDFFDGLEPEDWERTIYEHQEAHGRWSVRELLAHLVTSGSGLLTAAQLMAQGRLNMRPDFDRDFWNQRQVDKQQGREVADLLAELDTVNEAVQDYLDELGAREDSAAILERRGQHAVFGEVPVEFLLRRIYRHEREHLEVLQRTLKV